MTEVYLVTHHGSINKSDLQQYMPPTINDVVLTQCFGKENYSGIVLPGRLSAVNKNLTNKLS